MDHFHGIIEGGNEASHEGVIDIAFHESKGHYDAVEHLAVEVAGATGTLLDGEAVILNEPRAVASSATSETAPASALPSSSSSGAARTSSSSSNRAVGPPAAASSSSSSAAAAVAASASVTVAAATVVIEVRVVTSRERLIDL